MPVHLIVTCSLRGGIHAAHLFSLASQNINSIQFCDKDSDKCMTCGRERGHNPVKYNERLKEIRQWKMPQDS